MNHLVKYCDACCDPNPSGPIGWAHVLIGADGSEIGSDRGAVPAGGHNTTNVGEYVAFGRALKSLLDRLHTDPAFRASYPGVAVRTDSQLVAKQLLGEWGVKDANLRRYCDRCLGLVAQLKDFGPLLIEWIPGVQNIADAASREAFRELIGHYPKVWTKANRKAVCA